MKILYLGVPNDPKYEGAMKVFSNLEKRFSKGNLISKNSISRSAKSDIIHIFSSGFIEAFKNKEVIGRSLYSLNSNIKPEPRIAYDVLQDKLYLYDNKDDPFRLKYRQLIFVLSQFIPLFLKRFFLKKSRLLIVGNQVTKDLLNLKNSTVIRHGIDLKIFSDRGLRKPSGKLRVSYFGHIAATKGLIEVIRSFSKLDKNDFDRNIYISALNRKVKMFIGKNSPSIKVHGNCKDIANEYNKTDIAVFPFRHSCSSIATPLVLVEAMACGCAIVTTDLPHIREICKDSVVYVKPYSVDQIVSACEKLKRNPNLRARLGTKAKMRANKYFGVDQMLEKYEKIYKQFKKS